MKKVIAIFGGNSLEHDVSIITAVEGLNACPYTGYKVYPVYIYGGEWYSSESMLEVKTFINFEPKKHKKVCLIGKNLYFLKGKKWRYLEKIDCALLFTHGGEGENGALQGFLEISGVPYTSSSVGASGLCMDKYNLKLALKDLRINRVKGVLVDRSCYENLDGIEKTLGYPLFVKPNSQGSSIGVGGAKNREELEERLEVAFNYDDKVLLEREMVDFTEYNCAVVKVGEEYIVSEVEKPMNFGEYLSFEDKYLDFSKSASKEKREFPALISEKLKDEICAIALKAYKKLDLWGVVRFDFIYKDKLYLNEINTIPGSLAHYLFTDRTYTELLKNLIDGTIERGIKRSTTFTSPILFCGSSGKNKG